MDITLDDRLNVLQQISQRKLIEILDAIPGSKDLIIEQKLMKVLDTFVGVTALERYGVSKIYKLEQGLKPSNSQRIFLVSSDLIACKRVLDQIRSELSPNLKSDVKLSHHMIITPLLPTTLESLVEEEGLAGLVTLHMLSWECIKLDGNVLSLENPMFTDLYYHQDNTLLPALARNLWSLQLILGTPKLILSLGKYSQQTIKLTETFSQCLGNTNAESEIGALILMDRSYDFVTPLLTPVTYAALLNEIANVNVGTVSLDSDQTQLDPNKDDIYGEVRDTPCSDVFPILHAKAKLLKSEQQAVQKMKLAEMERYVATKLQKTKNTKRLLAFHISACQKIADTLGSEFQTLQSYENLILDCKERKKCLNYIENIIDEQPMRGLRLLCLLSITSDGISQSELSGIQKSYLHAHGYQHIPLFHKLRNIGLLRHKAENILNKLPNWNSEWMNSAQRFKLLPSYLKRTDHKGRSCPSYVFSNAYIPLIAQILNIVINQEKESRSFEDLLNMPNCSLNGQRGSLIPKIVLICVIGGITNAEISACRLVEKTTGIRLVLASDVIITSTKLIERIQDI